jgi:spore coat protein H
MRHRLLAILLVLGWAHAPQNALAQTAPVQTTDDLFDDSRLHDVHVRLSERDWASLRVSIDDDAFYPADLTWNGITVRNVALRQRGLGTRTASKPNLRVDVNRYISAQRLVGLTGFNLDNQYSDPSMLRDTVAMKVFERMGIPAPRQAHARLFVNDTFAGVYTIVEPVNRQFIGRVFGDADANPESGGYLYEYRWLDEYDFSYPGPALGPYAAMFRAQTRDTDALISLYAPLEDLVRLINETPGERFAIEVGAQLDLAQMVRLVAVQNCIAELDGFIGYYGVNNFYLYRFRDGRPAILIPWDADYAFSSADMPLGYRLTSTVLMRRAMEVPTLAQLYAATVSACAASIDERAPGDARGWLTREIERRAALIAPSAALDRFALYNYSEFVPEVARLLDFGRLRPSYLRCQVEEFATTGRFANRCVAPPSPTPTPGIASGAPEQ